jgi:hypothetical protein
LLGCSTCLFLMGSYLRGWDIKASHPTTLITNQMSEGSEEAGTNSGIAPSNIRRSPSFHLLKPGRLALPFRPTLTETRL